MLNTFNKFLVVSLVLGFGLTTYSKQANIQIKIDTNSFYNTSDSNNNLKIETNTNSKNVEIKDNTGSTINTEALAQESIGAKVSDQKIASPVTDSTTAVTSDSTTTQKTETDISPILAPFIPSTPLPTTQPVVTPTVQPPIVPIVIPTETTIVQPVVDSTVAPTIEQVLPLEEVKIVTPILEPTVEIVPLSDDFTAEEKPAIQSKIISKPTQYSVRGGFGFGTFTSIEDISSKFSFGFAVGYDVDPVMNIEFQYIFSEYEDSYNYNYGASVSGYNFDQSDFGLILNYKIIPNHDYNLILRGGLNYVYRSAHNSYTGDTNNSNSFGVIFGIAGDYRVSKNLFITSQLDYNTSLTSSGYNSTSSPLFLVADESYMTLNFGLKFLF